jgi:hypothetical protein
VTNDLQTLWRAVDPVELTLETARIVTQLAALRARSPARHGGFAARLSAAANSDPDSAYLLAGLRAPAAGPDSRPDPVALGWLVVAAGQGHKK